MPGNEIGDLVIQGMADNTVRIVGDKVHIDGELLENPHFHNKKNKDIWADAAARAAAVQRIQESWSANGANAGPLGIPHLPMRIVDGAFQQNYRGGTIRVLAGTAEATVRHRVIVRYTGMHCFGAQRGPGDDEMYALISIYAPEQGDVNHASIRIPTPDGVVEMNDGRSSAEGTTDLWRGPPQDLVMIASLWEHDNSSPDDIKTVVDGAFVSAITTAAVPATGLGAVPIGAVSAWLIPKITSWILENAFGFGDDNIGNWASPPFHFDDLMGATTPRTAWAGLEYNFQSDLITDGDASYKLFFDVIHEEISEVLPAH